MRIGLSGDGVRRDGGADNVRVEGEICGTEAGEFRGARVFKACGMFCQSKEASNGEDWKCCSALAQAGSASGLFPEVGWRWLVSDLKGI